MSFPSVTVIVPTFNRPDGLKKAVSSVFAQTLSDQSGFDLIIVDNHPDGTAHEMIETLRKDCPSSVHFTAVNEPRAGVANARNAAMTRVRTDLVAFLDDDMTAPKDWLEQILKAREAYPAPVVFGPVITALPDDVSKHRAYFEAFFARDPGHVTGLIEESYGCGNSLIDFSKVPGTAPWFDETMNEIGGEDDRLFQRIREAGLSFAWAADAPVNEHPLPNRIHLSYTLRRAFSYGQAPITLARLSSKRQYGTIAKWMTIGAGKTVLHGFAWLALFIARHPNRAFQLDKAIRGLSKVLWFLDFKFYGSSSLKNSTPNVSLYTPRPKSTSAKADEA